MPAARARGARELEEIETNLLVGLGGVRDSRRRLVGNGQGAEAEGIDDDGAPVRDWQRGGAGELRWSKAKLLGWLGGVEQYWSGGSSAAGFAGDEERARRRYAGEEAQSGLFITQRGDDEREGESRDEFSRGKW